MVYSQQDKCMEQKESQPGNRFTHLNRLERHSDTLFADSGCQEMSTIHGVLEILSFGQKDMTERTTEPTQVECSMENLQWAEL